LTQCANGEGPIYRCQDGLVERNVATVVRAPSVAQQEVQPWSTEEAATFLESASRHRLHGLFSVGVALGLRKGELLALRWEDVDLDARTIRARQTVQRLPHVGLVYGPPDSLRSRRTIPLPDASARALRRHRHRAMQAAEALAAGPALTTRVWSSARRSARSSSHAT